VSNYLLSAGLCAKISRTLKHGSSGLRCGWRTSDSIEAFSNWNRLFDDQSRKKLMMYLSRFIMRLSRKLGSLIWGIGA
jgi:hypothetical protein